jgi:FdhE protein
MSPAAAACLQDLRLAHPEWRPWLSVVDEVLAAATDPHWDDCIPAVPQRAGGVLLAHASISIPIDFLRLWLKNLLRTAAVSGTTEMATLKAAERSAIEAAELFHAALTQDSRRLARIAMDCGADEKAFRGVANLMPLPFLHACRRAWKEGHLHSWMERYCPLCGAWPALAEVRGIDKARYLRCGRCGSDWQAYGLTCVFCKNDDHEQLVSLVPQNDGFARVIEGCKQCSGYLKSFTRLQGVDALAVMLEDLASVDLDIAAVEQGYRRPENPGYPLELTVGYDPSKGISSRRGKYAKGQ